MTADCLLILIVSWLRSPIAWYRARMSGLHLNRQGKAQIVFSARPESPKDVSCSWATLAPAQDWVALKQVVVLPAEKIL